MKKCIAGLLLLAFAVPSWAEDDVWYCVEEHNYKLEDQNKDGVYKLEHYKDEKFTFKYEADEYRLAIVGRTWAGEAPYYLDCDGCYSSIPSFSASDNVLKLKFDNSRFFVTLIARESAEMTTGTCTKF